LGKLSTRLKVEGLKDEGFCQSRAVIKSNVQLTPQYRACSNCYHCCGCQNITLFVPLRSGSFELFKFTAHSKTQFFHDHLKLLSYLNIDLPSVLIDINWPEFDSDQSFPFNFKEKKEFRRRSDTPAQIQD